MTATRTSRIYLIRHGQVNGYRTFPVYGHTDVALTEVGMLQMERVAQRLRHTEPAAIYSSDLQRAAKGAQAIASYHDVPLYALKELREMRFGDWEGLTIQGIRDQFPDELLKRSENILQYRAPGNAESIADLFDRIDRAFERIQKEQEGRDVVIVAHGGVNRVILCRALGLLPSNLYHIQQDYGCLNIIDYFPDAVVVKLMNG